jgi:hypothetical protein
VAAPALAAIRNNDSRWDRLVRELASQLIQLQPAVEKILRSSPDEATPACMLLADQADVIGSALGLLTESVNQFNHTCALIIGGCLPPNKQPAHPAE